MGNVSTVKTEIVSDIEVCDLNSSVHYSLPNTFALKSWPFDACDSPSEYDVLGFNHLSDINFNFVAEEIGLLVGANVPDLIKPLETVSGGEFEPFAIRYSIGWSIAGPVGEQVRSRVVCHRVKTNDLQVIEKKFDRIFSEDFKMPSLMLRDTR